MVSRHNKLRDVFFFTSANVLAWVHVWRWVVGLGPIPNPALQMFLSLTGTLANLLPLTCPSRQRYIQVASMTVGSAALVAENRKHNTNDRKCEELGWVCIPLVVETYGCWGAAAVAAFSKLAGRLSTRLNKPKS